jgi:hypothetical protein
MTNRTEIRLKGVPDKFSGVHLRYSEPDDRNLTPAQAQLNNLLQSSNRMHRPIERIDSCSRWTIHIQLDSHDGVAISIDLRELIEARSVHDRFGVIGSEARGRWTKRSSLRIHCGTFPHFGERRLSKCAARGWPRHYPLAAASA